MVLSLSLVNFRDEDFKVCRFFYPRYRHYCYCSCSNKHQTLFSDSVVRSVMTVYCIQ